MNKRVIQYLLLYIYSECIIINKKLHDIICKNNTYIFKYGIYAKQSLLEYMILEGSYDIVKILIENRINVNTDDDTSLRSALITGDYDIVKLLIENGANVHANNDFALSYASLNGYYDIIQLFIEKGVNIRSNNDIALRSALFTGHNDIAKLLIENGSHIPQIMYCGT